MNYVIATTLWPFRGNIIKKDHGKTTGMVLNNRKISGIILEKRKRTGIVLDNKKEHEW